MSGDDGNRQGAPEVENTLVAALGFEPTSGLADDGTVVLVDDGTGDALDWSGSDGVSAADDCTDELQSGIGQADWHINAPPPPPAAPPTAKAADAMTPPKGKGKGPRKFQGPKSGPTQRATGTNGGVAADEDLPDPDESISDEAGDDIGPVVTIDDEIQIDDGPAGSVDADPAPLDQPTPGLPIDTDPVDVVDVDGGLSSPSGPSSSSSLFGSSSVRSTSAGPGQPQDDAGPSGPILGGGPPAITPDLPNLPPPSGTPSEPIVDATSQLPKGVIPQGSTQGAHDPPPPLVEPPSDGDAPETIVVDGLTLGVAPSEASAPPTGPVALGSNAAAETVITQAPPTAPPTMPPHGYPAAEATPVLDPPPPAVVDPTGTLTTAPNGAVAPGAVVTNRAGATPRVGGELAGRVPQLLDQRFLKRTRRVRARKVRRVVRHIDPWSVLTFSVLFFLCLFAAFLLASVLVWNTAIAAGTIENIESFIREIGDYQTYEIKGDVVFQAAMIIAGIMTLVASVMVVLLVVVFNLISDLVGGIRLTVIEEETVRVRRRKAEAN